MADELTESYRPWDREEKLGPVPEGGFKPDDPKVIAWEAAHGHDLRLKCLPEYGCQLVEARAERIEEAAWEVVISQEAFLAAPEGAPTLHRSHILSHAIAHLKEALDD